jgi:hypothetical protein
MELNWRLQSRSFTFDSTFFCLVANREFYMLQIEVAHTLPLLLKGSIRFQSSKCVLDLYLMNSDFC